MSNCVQFRAARGGQRLFIALALVGSVTAARADGDAARGEKRFEECASCHSVESNVNGVGPSLHGIFERKAGTIADFRYSPAMKRSGITWSPQTVETFISDPQKLVPANRMPYAGMADASDRADLIAFLRKASQ